MKDTKKKDCNDKLIVKDSKNNTNIEFLSNRFDNVYRISHCEGIINSVSALGGLVKIHEDGSNDMNSVFGVVTSITTKSNHHCGVHN